MLPRVRPLRRGAVPPRQRVGQARGSSFLCGDDAPRPFGVPWRASPTCGARAPRLGLEPRARSISALPRPRPPRRRAELLDRRAREPLGPLRSARARGAHPNRFADDPPRRSPLALREGAIHSALERRSRRRSSRRRTRARRPARGRRRPLPVGAPSPARRRPTARSPGAAYPSPVRHGPPS